MPTGWRWRSTTSAPKPPRHPGYDPRMSSDRNRGSFLGRFVRWILWTLVIVLATIIFARALEARRPPPLESWHRFVPPSEVHAADMPDTFTLEDYLRREDRAFAEVTSEIEDRLPASERHGGNRYYRESKSSPTRFSRDWNRTFELVPPEIRGGALLTHGLTDSPYSMRRLGEILRDE